MSELKTLRDRKETHYALRFVKQVKTRRRRQLVEETHTKWAKANAVGHTVKRNKDGTRKRYERREWRPSNYRHDAYKFKEPTMAGKIAKVTKCFQVLMADGWQYQVVQITTREVHTRETTVIEGEGASPLVLLAKVAE
jgi:hypothetical protein